MPEVPELEIPAPRSAAKPVARPGGAASAPAQRAATDAFDDVDDFDMQIERASALHEAAPSSSSHLPRSSPRARSAGADAATGGLQLAYQRRVEAREPDSDEA